MFGFAPFYYINLQQNIIVGIYCHNSFIIKSLNL